MADTSTTTFTRMDESTAEQWSRIGAATNANQGRVADAILGVSGPIDRRAGTSPARVI